MKKTGSIVRIFLLYFFLFVFTINVSAQKVTLSYENVPFEKVLNSIKQQTGLALVFSEQIVNVNRRVSIMLTSVEVEDALKQLLAGTNVDFEIKNNKLYLVEKKIIEPKNIPNQSKKITGLVTDEKGDQIIGALVVL
ncbi:MAG: STN domain-containing protein, partial [Bacteroidales bacterium]